MNTQNGNKLIAIFMGAIEVDPIGNLERNISFKHPVNGLHCYNETGLKYDRSWDWLMPVVEKIKEYGKWTIEPGFATLELYRELSGYGNIESKRKRFSTSQMDWQTEFDEPVEWVFLVHNIVVQFLKYSSDWELKGQVTTGMAASTSLDGCPFNYCDNNPKCEGTCRYNKQ
jgi:hypothetical protein